MCVTKPDNKGTVIVTVHAIHKSLGREISPININPLTVEILQLLVEY